MLHAISWKEYFTLVVIGLLVYYGWWLVRFFPSLKLGGAGKADRGRLVESVPLGELMGLSKPVESSAVIRARIVKARAVQSERFKGLNGVYCNARMPEQSLDEYCLLDTHARRYLFGRLDSALVSARSYSRILKVSRTIADLASSSTVEVEHVAEAVHFRGLKGWWRRKKAAR